MSQLTQSIATRKAIAQIISSESVPDKKLLSDILDNQIELETRELLEIIAPARFKHHSNKVKIHILNNVRNGHCSEDCNYCAQRKNRKSEIPEYPSKTDQEILDEAKNAYESGAFRYCMVTSGRGLTKKSTQKYAELIRKIKSSYPLEICLSAGLVDKKEYAQELFSAGLDKYNHNLNTSESHYETICSTHSYQDRLDTIGYIQKEGISLCSGVIAGMGESSNDLAEVALTLRENNIESIPVNFFIPVPNHDVANQTQLNADFCLRVLCVFRLANPSSEIRMAAGREMHLNQYQADALQVADSLFVSGYLNAQGSNLSQTLDLIYSNGFEIDPKNSDLDPQLKQIVQEFTKNSEDFNTPSVRMKSFEELRPFQKV